MKKSFVAVITAAALALGTANVLAAELALNDPVCDNKTGGVSVNGTVTSPEADQDVTIIVIEYDASLAELESKSVMYINQSTVEDGTFSYDFTLTKGKKYKVYCGGTEVYVPTEKVINLEEPIVRISGSVSAAGKLDSVTVTALAGEKSFNGTVAQSGDYTLDAPEGTYDIVIGRPGYLYKTYKDVAVSGDGVKLGALELIPGKVADDGEAWVNISDLTLLLQSYKKTEFDAEFDLTDDGKVDISDLTLLISGYRRQYE